jgi:serine/threonine protein kinase
MGLFGSKDKKKKHNVTRKMPVIKSLEYENKSIESLIKELSKYRKVVAQTPNKLLEEILKRLNKNYKLMGIRHIGGEGAIVRVTNRLGRSLAVKIAVPYLSKRGKGKVDVRELPDDYLEVTQEYINEFQERFIKGTEKQDQIYQTIHDEGIEFICVPRVDLYEKPALYLEMDWIEGKPVIDWLQERNDIEYSLNLYLLLCDCIEFIHDRGVIHRDIKTPNLFFTKSNKNIDQIAVLDWNMAKTPGELGVTIPGQAIGTPKYSSPKQFLFRRAVNASYPDDIWSLGLCLWEFYHHRYLPEVLTIDDYKTENIESFELYHKSLVNSMPDVFKPVFSKSIALNEIERYQKISDFKKDLEAAIANFGFDVSPQQHQEMFFKTFNEGSNIATTPEILEDKPDIIFDTLLTINSLDICEDCNYKKGCKGKDVAWCKTFIKAILDVNKYMK